MTTYLPDGWKQSTKPEFVGWLQNTNNHELSTVFDEKTDALVRVFHFEHIGYVAVATVNDGNPTFAQGQDVNDAAKNLFTTLHGRFLLSAESTLSTFPKSGWKKYADKELKVKFESCQLFALSKAKAQCAKGDWRSVEAKVRELLLVLPLQVAIQVKLLEQEQQPKTKFGSLAHAFAE